MKKDFCQNIFLFSIPSQFLKLSFCKKPVFQLIKYFKYSNDIFGVSQSASFGLEFVEMNFVSKVCRSLATVSLAPI